MYNFSFRCTMPVQLFILNRYIYNLSALLPVAVCIPPSSICILPACCHVVSHTNRINSPVCRAKGGALGWVLASLRLLVARIRCAPSQLSLAVCNYALLCLGMPSVHVQLPPSHGNKGHRLSWRSTVAQIGPTASAPFELAWCPSGLIEVSAEFSPSPVCLVFLKKKYRPVNLLF